MERHFIVRHRDHTWQYSFAGNIFAPIDSREQAIAMAIAAARQLDDPQVRVIVQDSDLTQETVWQPDKSLPR